MWKTIIKMFVQEMASFVISIYIWIYHFREKSDFVCLNRINAVYVKKQIIPRTV